MEIEPLQPDWYGETARMLSRAFWDDPMWSFLTPDPAARPRTTAWVIEHWSRVVAPLGASWVAVDDGGGIMGAGLRFPPSRFAVSLGGMLRVGYWRMPLDLGFRWTVRSWGIFREGVDHQVGLMRPPRRSPKRRERKLEPYWVLDVLGVDPSRQGSGVGRKLVELGLELADREGVASFVVTHKKANVGYYERFGFVLVDEYRMSGGGPTAYSLRRSAKRTGSDGSDGSDRSDRSED